MLELADRGKKRYYNCVYYYVLLYYTVFRKLSRNVEDILKTQIKLLEIETRVCEIKNTVHGINDRLDITKENISELEDIGTMKNETQTQKRMFKNECQ